SFHFPLPSIVGDYYGQATNSGFARTDLAGYEDLFSWDIRLNQSGQAAVSFTSNPRLGLGDAAIRADILARYTFDPDTGDFLFDGGSSYQLSATFSVPADWVGNPSLTFETSWASDIIASVDPIDSGAAGKMNWVSVAPTGPTRHGI